MTATASASRKASRSKASTLLMYAELRAAEIHAQHGITSLADVPVDATVIAKSMGAGVFWADLTESNKEGFIYMPPAGAPEITINENSPRARKRFTTAHELGHLIHAREIGFPEEAGHVDDEQTLGDAALLNTDHGGSVTQLFPSEEDFANAFAAALLMPRPLVAELLRAGATTESLSATFHVSKGVAEYRTRSAALAPMG